MPELPEVQTIVNELNSHVLPRTVIGLRECRPGTVVRRTDAPEPWRITRASRRGKFIVLHGEHNIRLVAHLRMTGKFVFQSAEEAEALYPSLTNTSHTHVRAQFTFTDGSALLFIDPRTFGVIEVMTARQARERLAGLGVEPLSKRFDTDYLQGIFLKRGTPVKALLLRQELIAGIGNIYASEILHRAGIAPQTPAAALLADDLARLVSATRRVLRLAIRHGGTSISDYRRVDDKTGEFQGMLRVYGKPQCRCGAVIQREMLAGRSTWWCPQCQPLSDAKYLKGGHR